MEYVVPKYQELLTELGPDASGELSLSQRIEIALFSGILPDQDGTISKPDHPSIRDGSVENEGALMTWKNSVSSTLIC